MVFVLSDVFSETDDLSCSGFSRNVEAGHADGGGCTAVINYAPHSLYNYMMNIFRDGDRLRIRPGRIERLEGAAGPIVRRSGVTYCF